MTEMAITDTYAPAYLHGLNHEQLKAVQTLQGPVLILAGAGTGKTRALTTRIVNLLATSTAYPAEILAVTFTNKAAEEMRHRVHGFLNNTDISGWWIGTFHSLAARMLRRHAELVGLKSNYTIIDEDDQIRVLKQIFELNSLDAKTINPKLVYSAIDRWKNMGLRPQDVTSLHYKEDGQPLNLQQITQLYNQYQERLLSLNACDFGDLLLHLVHIFKSTENGVLQQYQARFKYILVDEYQDTNTVQYQWLRLLAQAHRNICCVGDDDQSIYAWRGSDISNILNFEKDFPNATIIRLEQNYRSTGTILKAANHLISHNKGRLGKNLWTQSEDGEKVSITAYTDQNDESRSVISTIESLEKNHTSLDDIAILVRTSSQMRTFEERLNTVGMSYRVIGGPRFYERMEIRDAIAYLRLIVQPNDDLAFERIINTPKRGLGAKTIQDIQAKSRQLKLSLLHTTQALLETDEFRPSVRSTLLNFTQQIQQWSGLIETTPPQILTTQILEESGYQQMWRNDKSIEANGRLENLKELINAISNFTSLAGFLEHVSLVMENQDKKGQASITLMTLHAAKGLEFNHVFLPGWEEGLFPSQRSMDDNGIQGLEEERRLAYVGITRAKRQAYISYALRRQLYGEYSDTAPSRFISELPNDHVVNHHQNLYNRWTQQQPSYFGANNNRWQKRVTENPNYGTVTDKPRKFSIGQRVFHDKFGYGKIIGIMDDKCDIVFEKSGPKKVLENFLKSENDL